MWDVPFKQGETVRIRNTYKFGGYEDARGNKEVTYVLRTGALWKGPIGKAKIIINGIDPRFIQSIEPKGYVFNGNTITWDMQNVEPESDISVRYYLQWHYFAALCNAYFARGEQKDADTKEFVSNLDFFLGELYPNLKKGTRVTLCGYIMKILDTIPHEFFNGAQLGRMLDFLGQNERAVAVATDYLERVEKKEIPYNFTTINRISNGWIYSRDATLYIKARLIEIDNMKYNPNYPDLVSLHYQKVGNLAKSANDYENAITYYTKSMETAGMNQQIAARSLYDIADCYMRLKNYDEAKKHYNMIIDKYPGWDYAAYVRKQLYDLNNIKERHEVDRN